VIGDPIAHLSREVHRFKHLNDPHRLKIVAESRLEFGDHLLPEVTEGRMAQIVAETDRFDEIFVESEGARDRAGHLRDLERMGQPNPVVVSFGSQENLGLMGQSAERLGMQDAISILLEAGADGIGCLRLFSTLGFSGELCPLRERLSLDLFCS
jgi:hypothetical protein